LNLADLATYAAGALRGHRLRTVLCVTGVAAGVAAVVLLVSLGEGARTYVAGQFGSLGTNLIIVVPGRSETVGGAPPITGGVVRDLTLEDAEALARHAPHVRKVAPISLGTAPVKYGERGRYVTIVGATPAYMEIRQLEVAAGQGLPETDPRQGARVCLIGRTVQRELFEGDNPLGKVVRVGEWRFRVVGVLARKGQTLGLDVDDIVIVPVGTAMRQFNRSSLFRIIGQAGGHGAVPTATEEIREVLTARHEGYEDFTIITQDAVLDSFGQILDTLTLALVGIAAISLVVAGIGVMNVMLVSVAERIPEVGLMKAIGARNGQVLAVFLAEAVTIALIGGACGVAGGLAGAALLRWMYPALPAWTPAWSVASALGVSILVGLLFGVLPARRAAALDPAGALGREN